MSDVSPPPVEWKYDYVQPGKPPDAVEGESWYDYDDDRAYVFTDDAGLTKPLTVTEHAQLSGIVEDAHHNPVTTAGPLTVDGSQTLDLLVGGGLDLDADGKLRVAPSAVSASMLSFDPATQSELNTHADDSNNPHGVTDEQTGASEALSNHANEPTAHTIDETIVTSRGNPVKIMESTEVGFVILSEVGQDGVSVFFVPQTGLIRTVSASGNGLFNVGQDQYTNSIYRNGQGDVLVDVGNTTDTSVDYYGVRF